MIPAFGPDHEAARELERLVALTPTDPVAIELLLGVEPDAKITDPPQEVLPLPKSLVHGRQKGMNVNLRWISEDKRNIFAGLFLRRSNAASHGCLGCC